MTLTIVSRERAGLPPVPSSIGHRSLDSWTGIVVHHTGGRFSSWRAVHDWQVHTRPAGQRLAYCGYSFGIADGRVTELRGWPHHPAHDHQNATLGVVFGGNYTNSRPSDEDLAAFVELARLAREKTGKRLPITGHRDTWPRGDRRYSSCPGDRLYAYLSTLRRRVNEEDDVSAEDVARYGVPRVSDGQERPWSRMDAWTNEYAKRAVSLAREALARLAAIEAAASGQDVSSAVRAELDRHRDLLLGDLAEQLDGMEDRLTGRLPDLPPDVAEQVRAALRAELDDLVLTTSRGEPAEDPA